MTLLLRTLCVVFLFGLIGHARLEFETHRIGTLSTLPFERDQYDRKALYRRQVTDCDRTGFDDPDVPTCRALCSPASDPCSGDPGSSLPDPDAMRYIRSLADYSFNESSEVTDSPNQDVYLSKRVITSVTQAELPEYLHTQFEKNPDALFGRPTPLSANPETDATVTVQRKFNKKNAFQIGSRALHGCTMVTVISKRAVYMGHFWENPAWVKESEFKARVLNRISGDGKRTGIGPALQPDLFNQVGADGTLENGDGTRIYIMSPRRGGFHGTNYQSPNYRSKLPRLKSLLIGDQSGDQGGEKGLLPGAPTALWLYKALETQDPEQNELFEGNNQFGKALFQYDPNGKGPGQPSWRLFYEEHVFTDTDPPPGEDSANGVPDL